jgi:hypothetical protein
MPPNGRPAHTFSTLCGMSGVCLGRVLDESQLLNEARETARRANGGYEPTGFLIAYPGALTAASHGGCLVDNYQCSSRPILGTSVRKGKFLRSNEIPISIGTPTTGGTTMSKSTLILATVLVLGTASGARADSTLGASTDPSAMQDDLRAYAQQRAQTRRRTGTTPVRAPAPAEKLWFDRASSPETS